MDKTINKKINDLRVILEKKILNHESYEDILKASQDLDKAINEYYQFTKP